MQDPETYEELKARFQMLPTSEPNWNEKQCWNLLQTFELKSGSQCKFRENFIQMTAHKLTKKYSRLCNNYFITNIRPIGYFKY